MLLYQYTGRVHPGSQEESGEATWFEGPQCGLDAGVRRGRSGSAAGRSGSRTAGSPASDLRGQPVHRLHRRRPHLSAGHRLRRHRGGALGGREPHQPPEHRCLLAAGPLVQRGFTRPGGRCQLRRRGQLAAGGAAGSVPLQRWPLSSCFRPLVEFCSGRHPAPHRAGPDPRSRAGQCHAGQPFPGRGPELERAGAGGAGLPAVLQRQGSDPGRSRSWGPCLRRLGPAQLWPLSRARLLQPQHQCGADLEHADESS